MNPKHCARCKWLNKYTSESGFSFIYVCEAEETGEGAYGGFYLVTTVSLDEIDPSWCLNFREKQ